MKYLKLLRVRHYVKNLLIMLPLFFSGTILSAPSKLLYSFIAFISFYMISSSIYVFNDIYDIEQDRNHPRESKRTIASGAVSVKTGIIIMICLVICGGTINFVFLSQQALIGGVYLAVYLIINVFSHCI